MAVIGVTALAVVLAVVLLTRGSGSSKGKVTRGTTLSLDTNSGIQVNRNVKLGNVPMGADGTWTIFVYLCGADLESAENGGFATLDMQEMSAASTGKNVRFVIQTGGANQWHNEVVASELGRYEICDGRMSKIDTQADASMGSADTLADFLKWGVENYPAANMGVVFWNHGGGSIVGVCVDEKWQRDKLSLTEIDSALCAVSGEMTDRFEFIGFDACLMATVESANILAPYANYMYASEENEAGYGWDYTAIGNYLGRNPGADGEELGKVVCDSYFDMLEQIDAADSGTLSVTDLSKLDNLVRCYHLYAKELAGAAKDLDAFAFVVRGLRGGEWFGSNSKVTGYTNMIDLAATVSAGEEYSTKTSQVLEAIDEAVVYQRNGSEHKNACGLATYYPLAFNGQTEIETFADIAISPYYLSFVTRSIYGLTHNGDMSGYVEEEVVDVWGDTWSGESAAGEADDYWDNYANGESSGRSRLIQFEQEPMIAEGWDLGYEYRNRTCFGFKLTEESEKNVAAIYVNEWMLSSDEKYLFYCGNHYISHVGEQYGYGYCYDFRPPWSLASDNGWLPGIDMYAPDRFRQPVTICVLDVGGGHKKMLAPMLVNGEPAYVRVGLVLTDDYWQGLDADGIAGRDFEKLKDSDVLVPMCPAISVETGEQTVHYGVQLTVRETKTGWRSLYLEQNAATYLNFELIDVFGNSYQTDLVCAIFKDGKLANCTMVESE